MIASSLPVPRSLPFPSSRGSEVLVCKAVGWRGKGGCQVGGGHGYGRGRGLLRGLSDSTHGTQEIRATRAGVQRYKVEETPRVAERLVT